MGYREIFHYKEIFYACFFRKIKFIKIKFLESNIQFITNYSEGKSSTFVINANSHQISGSILCIERQTRENNLGRFEINIFLNMNQFETSSQVKPNNIIF